MKKCIKCGEEKNIEYFYKHPKTKDGRLNKCIECCKENTKKNLIRKSKNPEWLESERIRHREKYYRLGYKDRHKPNRESKKKAMSKYREKYPEKIRAVRASSSIKKKGYENHHWSYNEEHYNDVIFLTKKDHMKLHRFIKYDKETFKYRTINGKLLKTKKEHYEYFKSIEKLK